MRVDRGSHFVSYEKWGFALDAAAKADVPLPSTEIWRNYLKRAIERGEGDLDWAVMAREQARSSGLEK